MKAVVGRLLRIFFIVTWLFTSFYSLLAYIPFTYRQVLEINLIPWLNLLAAMQPVLLLLSNLLLSVFVYFFELEKEPKLKDKLFGASILIFALSLAIYNLPAHLVNSVSSYFWSFYTLIPLFIFGLWEISKLPRKLSLFEGSIRLINSGFVTGLLMAIVYGYLYDGIKPIPTLLVIGFFMGISSVLCLGEQMLFASNSSVRTNFLFYGLFLSGGASFILFAKVAAAISFFGMSALSWSLVFGSAVGLSIAGFSAFSYQFQKEQSTALVNFVRGVNPIGTRSFSQLAWLIVLVFLMIGVGKVLPSFDWNGLTQSIATTLISCYLFFLSYSLLTRFRLKEIKFKFQVAFTASVCLVVFLGLQFKLAEINRGISFNPLVNLAKNSIFSKSAHDSLYEFIQSHTNLSKDVRINLNELKLSMDESKESKRPPLVFIFVIDSLRRDYLAAYNDKVNFTPEILKFSQESVIFKNAFTRYGATGLSEPSIWSGRMIPHQMYPQPFSKINLLEKVLTLKKFETWISRDSILKEILSSKFEKDDLDQSVATQDLDLCTTAQEIEKRLQEKTIEDSLFTYAQSQNIHVSVLARTAAKSILTDQFIGFYPPYARALQRVDECFGHFITTLKDLKLFEKSLIILTSDHGDSLGEGGRYGHAYTVFPEVIRIPLLIHLPTDMQEKVTDLNSPVFLTDIAPTISSLLGVKFERNHWSEGRSLFRNTSEKPDPDLEQEHLVVSSYGPVAGILSNNGQSLFIADAVNFMNYDYRIEQKGAADVGVTAEANKKNEELIQQKINQLHAYFGL